MTGREGAYEAWICRLCPSFGGGGNERVSTVYGAWLHHLQQHEGLSFAAAMDAASGHDDFPPTAAKADEEEPS